MHSSNLSGLFNQSLRKQNNQRWNKRRQSPILQESSTLLLTNMILLMLSVNKPL